VTALLRAGRYDEAAVEARDAVELEPGYDRARATLGWAYFLSGKKDEGLVELEEAVAISPRNTMWLGQLGEAYAMAGNTAKAREILGELEERARVSFVSPYHIAYVYTGLGEFDRAMDSLERAVAACHAQLAAVEAQIKAGVTRAAVAHFDETGVNLAGQTNWLDAASTGHLTFYAAHPKRGREAFDAIGLLPLFRGRAVHDGWGSYWQYATCAHALCNGHHLRELTFVEEELGQIWARDLKKLLREIKQTVETARTQGRTELAQEVKREFATHYDTILADGLQVNPPPAPTGQRGRPKRGKAGSLVDRLIAHKEPTLAFLDDFAVPFDNNLVERDIRMTKVREKISGCFRTPQGAARFCRIRGYISTLRKQGMPILSSLGQAIAGNPPLPATN